MNEEQLIKVCKIGCVILLSILLLTAVTVSVIMLTKDRRAPDPKGGIDHMYDGPTYTPAKITYNRAMFSYNPGVEADKQAPAISDLPIVFEEVSINSHYSVFSQECNAVLYKICRENFSVSIGNVEVSPLMPMVIANNESGIRADTSLTFSALYPSKILQPKSTDDIINASCLDVLRDEKTFSKLAADWWTRDRGPVQMNPSYGIRDDLFYSAMGKSEKELLKDFDNSLSASAYTTKEGSIDVSYWIEQASGERGDRFNPKDICLRLSSEYNYALKLASQTYTIDTSLLALAMCSIHHGAGSVWSPEYTDTKVGYWVSGGKAYELACALTSQAAYDIIHSRVVSDITKARATGQNPNAGLSTEAAYDIYMDIQKAGIIKNMSYYVNNGDYSKDYIVYPIKALYGYMQLSLLYNGG